MKKNKLVAYLSAEFAIDSDLPTYAGGLGVLAGDLMYAAAEENFPMVGIGILYKGKDFVQHITGNGKEEKRVSQFDHDTSFLKQTTVDGEPLIIEIPAPESKVFAKAYELCLGKSTTMYFLSTDLDGNPAVWREDMGKIYGGNEDSQIRQQILLGVGGYRLLKKLGMSPSIYHLNEGRPVFVIWEIVHKLMNKKNLSFKDAWVRAKEKIVYTNHTLVSAGNPTYNADTVRWWARPCADEMKVDVEDLIKKGVVDGRFSITDFAINISNKQSAVSKVHGDYAKEKYPSVDWKYITNGVHFLRWQDSDYRKKDLTDEYIWRLHLEKKNELVNTVINRTGLEYDSNKLVITWARRLAEYKQPKIIFSDLKRLKRLVSKDNRSVQILFAGNSHSADPHSKGIIEDLISLFSNELRGSAIFVPNYNIALANHLTSGSDIWLNTPKGNLEACGTSGMKAISNGVLNCTVLDGWTYEVDWEGIGWILDADDTANDLYDKLENEIIPMYFDRDKKGIPVEWIKRMKKSIILANNYSATRMLNDYRKLLYQNPNSS